MRHLSDRTLVAAAVIAAALCLFLAPIQSAVSAGPFGSPSPIVVALGAFVDAGDAIYRAVGRGLGGPYEFWGRLFPLVDLGAAAGILLVRRRAARSGPARRPATGLVAALVLGAAVDAGAYWSFGTPLQPILWSGGFVVELVLIGIALLLALWLAVALLRSGRRGVGGVLLGGLALVVPGMLAVDYLPHGAMLPIVSAAALAAVLELRQHRVEARPAM